MVWVKNRGWNISMPSWLSRPRGQQAFTVLTSTQSAVTRRISFITKLPVPFLQLAFQTISSPPKCCFPEETMTRENIKSFPFQLFFSRSWTLPCQRCRHVFFIWSQICVLSLKLSHLFMFPVGEIKIKVVKRCWHGHQHKSQHNFIFSPLSSSSTLYSSPCSSSFNVISEMLAHQHTLLQHDFTQPPSNKKVNVLTEIT